MKEIRGLRVFVYVAGRILLNLDRVFNSGMGNALVRVQHYRDALGCNK